VSDSYKLDKKTSRVRPLWIRLGLCAALELGRFIPQQRTSSLGGGRSAQDLLDGSLDTMLDIFPSEKRSSGNLYRNVNPQP
jgi:hypothetical protein